MGTNGADHSVDSSRDPIDDLVQVLSDRTTALYLAQDPPADEQPYPPLPKINSKEILAEVFMHRSVMARRKDLFEDNPDDLFPDNERLEHLGDAVVQLCATMLIRQLYPSLRVGPATKIRSYVVNNAALAKHAVRYGLVQRLAVGHAQEKQLRLSIGVHGDLFEAYVGGLFKETNSLPAVHDWLKVLLKPFVEEGYRKEQMDHMITAGVPILATQGVTASKSLNDLFPVPPEQPVVVTPAVIDRPFFAPSASTPAIPSSVSGPSNPYAATPPTSPFVPRLAPSASSSASTPTPPSSPFAFTASRAESGQLSYLNQCLIQRSKTVEWEFEERGGNKTTPLWAVKALVANDEGVVECVGSAQAPTKKAAKNEAARQAITNLKYA